MTTATINHPTIGQIKGRDGDGVTQFLGVQYATLENRLAEAQVKSSYSTPVDATAHGPSSYGPVAAFDNEMLFIQQTVPKPPTNHSDLECLNLNITVPKTTQNTKIPVFVWMHGGGFVLGANSWPHYDHAKIVKLANENGVPVIGIGINFRLGFAGFMTSEELRSKGFKTNNQLRDQRAAYRWIKQHIEGFGGDADNITVIGESAGAAATTLQLYSKEKIFNRVIATGGSCLLTPTLPKEACEDMYTKALGFLGLESLSVDERIQKLLTLPADEIIAKLPPFVQFAPMLDDEIVPVRPTYASIGDPSDKSMPGKDWADAIMIGDSQFDASVLGFLMGHLKPNCREKFSTSLRKTFASNPKIAETLIEAYSLGGKAVEDDDEVSFKNFLRFANDIGFYSSTLTFARGWPEGKPVYTFFLNEPNPWPGAYQGETTHVLDVALLFQNYNDKLSAEQRAAAQGFGLDLMRFVAGQAPWENNTPSHRAAKVFGPSLGKGHAVTRVIDDAESPEAGRRMTVLELSKEVGFDAISQALRNFQMGL
ncbi:uncharacterized protein PV06_07234 [Exophiala oligosperma]|uniref:Carboxylic ester hydrolase n=1 Tax=Exophiala oligosperma TaxID=215243 RepID=A0A0D2DF62_9EURO|nr:uncharacterized protein PV06_07234 [Exophiala oligosperma]KIW41703.1 hypothetical protein PV06_07234 [Exophiala oligosperma]